MLVQLRCTFRSHLADPQHLTVLVHLAIFRATFGLPHDVHVHRQTLRHHRGESHGDALEERIHPQLPPLHGADTGNMAFTVA